MDEDYIGLFVKVKNNAMCSERFNDFFRNNIGNDLHLIFVSKSMMKKTRIVSEIPTEKSYYQGVFNEKYVEDILKSQND